MSDAWRLYMLLTTSKKPMVSGAFSEHGVPRMRDMMQLFRRDRAELIAKPMSIFTITATGNFRYGEDSCQNMLDCVEAGIPVEIVPVTLMGLIAPVTLVGALVFHCVDVLTGITMAQIVRPGAPVLFGGAPATFHMKCGELADGGDRGAAPQRRLCRRREVAGPADAGVHGAERRQVPRRAGRRRDHSPARCSPRSRASTRCPARACSISC